jgi:hypothetical protein
MSFLKPIHTSRVLAPDQLELLRRVYNRIVGEPWVNKDPEALNELALLVLNTYDNGVWLEKQIYARCLLTALDKFADPAFKAMLRK